VKNSSEHTICLRVNNQPGVLSRIAGVFSSRGYNIRSLCVAETGDPAVSRITLTSAADADFTEKIMKQLDKLIDVIDCVDCSDNAFVHRELMLIRVRIRQEDQRDLMRAADLCGCRIVAMACDQLIIEVTGSPEETEAVLRFLAPFGVEEMNRTGTIAVAREGAAGP
jgi:acetolactate synthase I/III small subunit